ncbi:hypothetical protein KR222_011016, partial [Zaprionus bogoriensis]
LKEKMDLYYLPFATPSRAVLMTVAAVGVNPNKKVINTFEKEQLKPEFVKLNPQHTIPTLVDNGFALWESRAIITYLAEKYGKDDSLYPKDPQKRALVNQRLYFDLGVLNQSFGEYYYPLFRSEGPADPEKFKKVEAAFEFLNTFLEGQNFVAGDTFTVADIAILATVTTFDAVHFDLSKYANVAKWYESVQKIAPGWQENLENSKEYTKRIDAAIKQ